MTQFGTPAFKSSLVQSVKNSSVSCLTGSIIIGIALLSLIGWIVDLSVLYSFGVSIASTKIHTAFLLLVVGCRLLAYNLKSLPKESTGNVLSIILLSVAIPAVLAFLLPEPYAIGIDRFFWFSNATNNFPAAFARPALVTSLCFIALGLAFVFIQRERLRMLGQFLALTCFLLVFVALLGHLAHIPAFYMFGTYSAIAMPTVLALALASIGILSVYPKQGLMRAITSFQAGGKTIRYLGIYLLLIPSLLVVLFLKLLDAQLASPHFLMLIVLCGFMVGSFYFLYWLANHLNAFDDKATQQFERLQATERELRKQYDLITGIQTAIQTALSALRAIRRDDGSIEDFEFVFKTEASYSLTNHSANDTIGARMLDVFPHTRKTGMLDRYISVVKTGQPQVFEQEYFADGVEGIFEIRAFRWGDGVVVSANNVTEMRQAERQRLREAAFTQKVLDGTTNGVLLGTAVRDAAGEIIDILIRRVNLECAKQFGRTVAETEGQLLGVIFPGIYPTGVFDLYAQTIELGVPQRMELYYGQDGLDNWGVVQTQPVEGDDLVITWVDVTAVKQGAKAIEQQRALLQTIVDTIPSGICLTEPVRNESGQIIDFRYLLVNGLNAKITGIPLEKFAGTSMANLLPGTEQTDQFRLMVQMVETGQHFQHIFRFDNFGIKGWFDVTYTCVNDCLLISFTDVTAIKQAELDAQKQADQLELTNFELKRSNENLQSFAYIASHDLQEPLRKITSFSDLLVKEFAPQLDTNAADILRRVNGSAHRMRTLIQDLLTYSRVETHQEAFRPVSLEDLILGLRENELWAAFQQTKAQVQVIDPPNLLADSFQMRQLFQNLLSNAIKFTPVGIDPRISISSRTINLSEIPVGLLSPLALGKEQTAAKRYYEISVTDNGIGFEQKYEDKIFQVFQRLHGRSHYEGSGIGLAICKRIVERHGGAITASSQPGRGSTFRVYLPCHL
jgi:signal transduction histidine kinase